MKKAKGTLIFFGYFFSIAGGIIGILFALIILLGKYDEESKNHAKIMLTCTIIAIISIIFVHTPSILKHLSTILLIYIVISSILGAVIAYKKKDFFSRGLFISMITGMLGVATLLFAPNSSAKESNEYDLHSWPKQRGLAPILFISLLIFLPITKTIQLGSSDKVLFADPLDGKCKDCWQDNPDPRNFIDHPKYGKAFYLETAKTKYPTTACHVGGETWSNYRVEFEVLCQGEGGGFVGLDFYVQNDGERSCNFEFFIPKRGDMIAFEHSGRWNKNKANWKLWPFSQPFKGFSKQVWMKIRLDAGIGIANVYFKDRPVPVYTIYDLPFSNGGIRFWEFHGSAYFRNLRVSQLPGNEVKPVLKDIWETVSKQDIIKEWEIIAKQPPGFGKEGIPEELKQMTWKSVKTDRRGILNLTAEFPDDLNKGVVFIRNNLKSDQETIKKCWISYTDRLEVWCNGETVFQGKPRGFYDPGRSPADGFGRLLPDQFELEIKLNQGENEILLRSELTEPRWGWGIWMRIGEKK